MSMYFGKDKSDLSWIQNIHELDLEGHGYIIHNNEMREKSKTYWIAVAKDSTDATRIIEALKLFDHVLQSAPPQYRRRVSRDSWKKYLDNYLENLSSKQRKNGESE